MNIDDIIYLKNILGGEEVKKYLKADEERLKMLIEVLKKTSLKRILNTGVLTDFCNKIVYAKYGKVYARVLCAVGKFKINAKIPIEYQLFLAYYINGGYNNKVEYKALFEGINNFGEFSHICNYSNHLKMLVEKEVEDANKNKITIDEFIQNGGSLDELIEVIKNQEIEDFNKDTKIPISLLKTIKSLKYEVSIHQIGYLVSLMSSLNLDKKTQSELLEVYYNGLQQSKQNGFSTNVLVVENKPRLYNLLKNTGLVANIIETEKSANSVKKLEKKK